MKSSHEMMESEILKGKIFMQSDELRQSVRVSKLFLTSYVNRDEQGQRTPVSLGRTLNVSRQGVGMEVFQEIETGTLMDLELDVKGRILPVRGRVIHVQDEGSGCFMVGIEFDEPQEGLEELQTD